MRHLRAALLAAATIVLLGSMTACGEEIETPTQGTEIDEVQVKDGWVRATEGTDDPSMTAAFMSITNFTDADVRLTGASSEVAGMVQIHEMVAGDDGAMVMSEVDGGLLIEAGKHAHLEPGGAHIMLMDLDADLAPGDEVTLTLELDNGDSQQLTLPVKAFTEEEGSYAPHSHGDG